MHGRKVPFIKFRPTPETTPKTYSYYKPSNICYTCASPVRPSEEQTSVVLQYGISLYHDIQSLFSTVIPQSASYDYPTLQTPAQPSLKGKRRMNRVDELVLEAGRGNYKTVARLIHAGVEIDAYYPPPGKRFRSPRLRNLGGPTRTSYSSSSPEPPAVTSRRTALQAAAKGGHKEVVILLKNAGANINAPPVGVSGRTALQAAAEGGHADLVTLLIEAGADVNAPPARNSGRTALQVAAGCGHKDLVELLIGSGADVNALPAESSGRTALQAAAEGGHSESIKSLIQHGADVNAPPAGNSGKVALQAAIEGGHDECVLLLIQNGVDIDRSAVGRTALQTAAESGNIHLVSMLIEAEADVNAPAASSSGRTALQAAAGSGHTKVVTLLIDAGAEVNALPAEISGRTALQAAAGGGHADIVALLLDAEADINAPPAGHSGRTALQAAAGSGHKDLVKLLIEAKANVNALPAANSGRTALQAAADGGHLEVVGLLITAGADVNALPASSGGKTALELAEKGGHEEVLSLLATFGANIDTTDDHGQNIVHRTCSAGNMARLAVLLGSPASGSRKRKYSLLGLDDTTKARQEPLAKPLFKALNAKNNCGQTPLLVAIRFKHCDLIEFLLAHGASTEGLKVWKMMDLLYLSKTADKRNIVILKGDLGQHRSIRLARKEGTIMIDLIKQCASPSLHFLDLNPSAKTYNETESFADPRYYLKSYSYPGGKERKTQCEWGWLAVNTKHHGALREKFIMKIPDKREIFSVKSSHRHEVVIVSYVCFLTLVHDPPEDLSEDGTKDSTPKPFGLKRRKVEISWIMKESKTYQKNEKSLRFQSVGYWGTLKLENLAIPAHGVEFLILFLDDIYENWLKLLGEAKMYLTEMRRVQLDRGGKDPDTTQCLLKCGHQWNELRTMFQEHVAKSKELLKSFKENDYLCAELPDYNEMTSPGDREAGLWKLKAIQRLSQQIETIKEECGGGIKELEKETGKLIGLEFSLVSIYEARRSIEMSASMKRLSWITFIFLPLIFVTGIFGMNINVLEKNPSWLWYIAVSVPLFFLVLMVWIIFKYVPIAGWVKKHIGSNLQNKANKATERLTASRKGADPLGLEDSDPISSSSSTKPQNDIPGMSPGRRLSLSAARIFGRRVPRDNHSDEEGKRWSVPT